MNELTQSRETAESNWNSVKNRLSEYVDSSGECWKFALRSKREDGVPVLHVGKRGPSFRRGKVSRVCVSVVRLLWRLEKGEWPPARLMNSCGDRECVNPDHWEPFSPDPSRSGRKISMADAEKIRKSGKTCRRLEREYGINRNSVSRIKRGEIYRR